MKINNLQLWADRFSDRKGGHLDRPAAQIISRNTARGIKMKKIPLTQGQFALVDDADYEELNQHKWHALWNLYTKSFYAVRNSKSREGKRHPISMAREILGLKFGDKKQADHINHVTLNNQRSNLRIVTHSQNQLNQKNPKGYYWHKRWKKFAAQITLNGKQMHLGYFSKTEDARDAYLKAKRKYHGISWF